MVDKHSHGNHLDHGMTHEEALHEKKRAALSSLFAAVLLTSFKLAVGIATNSLGVLAEAAHSALDLIAAGVTFFAIRISSLPPDKKHSYGHGKIENFSALIETLLLLFTCGWIVHEAIQRLFFNYSGVNLSIWALLVMLISIVVDFSRSRMLLRVAKKHKSQALEADALHFSTDILSSAVVIIGLGAVWLADFFHPDTLAHKALLRADAIAALIVALIVAWVSINLGREAINTLLDGGDEELLEKVEVAVRRVTEVRDISRLRLRESGPSIFVDMKLILPADDTLEEASDVTHRVEQEVLKILPGADITIHSQPDHRHEEQEKGILARIRKSAKSHNFAVHSVDAFLSRDKTYVTLHAEIDGSLSLTEAHSRVDAFERELQTRDFEIITHLEPKTDKLHQQNAVLVAPDSPQYQSIYTAVKAAIQSEHIVSSFHRLYWLDDADNNMLSLHCCIPGRMTVDESHDLTKRLELAIRENYSGTIAHITIHTDPEELLNEHTDEPLL